MTKVNARTLSLFLDVGKLIRARMERMLPISFTQCQVLWFISREARTSMRDIAVYFKISAPSATSLIQELVRKGYVARTASSGDRRKVCVALTTKGKRINATITLQRSKVIEGVLSVLSGEDRDELNHILEKILQANA